MNKLALALFFSSFFCSSVLLAKSNVKPKTQLNHKKTLKILNYQAVKKLSPKSRQEYIGAIAKTISKLEARSKGRFGLNFLDLIFNTINVAHSEDKKYFCVGGGVPIPISNGTCSVQSYAGFTCPEGLQICNPLIFGVDKDKKPVCNTKATTSWCFLNTKLGVNHFLEPVFELNNQRQWNDLLTHLEEACNNPGLIAENQELVKSACEFSRRQMVHNEEVKMLMNQNYSYQTVDGYGIQPRNQPVATPGSLDPSEITVEVLPSVEEADGAL